MLKIRNKEHLLKVTQWAIENDSFGVIWWSRRKAPPTPDGGTTPWDKPGEYIYTQFMNGAAIFHESDGKWSVHT